ncbi:uncharacterized protein C5L36_0B02070 [Pichia kudriavzevii]|uniref:DSC E3 ubiquitin ligase complex subunit 2 n=1 Tax=Pichia kudriavzevii TaxID=4909 RepID=A0A099NWD1_PICKU|nr:uncharacterized protein C5L36_0B02070 [Pichia kudriavzevii]AWU74943.1 hypothetical protein C5L36_0B02070 [Pichia kudriavzevii]KGK37113.1 hypothetical protein JL09_g3734 [Pichia kudriavzevii]ONH73251.1 DSC E3 ubiquitin ligase complex subunit 2 [Pichia kudriavzevii]
MSSILPKGFKLQPVMSSLTISIIGLPLFFSVMGWKPFFLFAWDPFISKWNQFWRLLILQLQFQNQSEITLASVLILLRLKGLERLYGSLKMFKILVLLYSYNLLIVTFLSFFLFFTFDFDIFIPSGPFGILFGLYYPFSRFIPETYVAEFDFTNATSLRIFGDGAILPLSDAFPVHFLFGILSLTEGVSSLIVSSIGYFIGILYFQNLLPLTDTSLGFLDPIYFKITHEKSFAREGRNNTTYNGVDSNHNASALDLDEENERSPSVEDNDTPVRSIGQEVLHTFTR